MKSKTKRVVAILLVAALCVSIISACRNPRAALAGTWVRASGGGIGINTIEFYRDGTYKSDYPNYYGSYSVEGNRLRLSGVLVSDITVDFKIRGKTLEFYTYGLDEPFITFEKR